MQRRTVLGIGVAGMAVTCSPLATAFGTAIERRWTEIAFRRLGAARRDAQLPALTLQPVLVQVAWRHVLHMESSGVTSHTGTDGSDPVARARRAGYSGRVLGEVLAETRHSTGTVGAWLEHEPTRSVLLNREASDAGISVIRGLEGRIWWSVLVGA